MADAFVLFRRLRGPAGVLSSVVRAYDTEVDVKAASAARQAELNRLLDAQLVFVQGEDAIPVGLSLRQFLGNFGVEEVGYEFQQVASGLIEDAPAPKIILAS